jgi:ABC-type uncharacterized transport system ATPase subunit
MPDNALVRMRGITKTFDAVQALRGVDFEVSAGSIHALLGENGAGKSTLMHVLAGLVAPDAGDIILDGQSHARLNPAAASAAGIGMVHQHFALIPTMTVAENVWLGRPGFRYDRRAAAALVAKTGESSGLHLDPGALVADLPMGLQQRLEILKALARDARVLILDEPGGALTPAEVAGLFAALHRMREQGLAIILITHKLREVAHIADRVTILRRGSVVAEGDVSSFGPDDLARAMIGDADASLIATDRAPRSVDARESLVLEATDVTVAGGRRAAVRGVSLEVRAHEIVGIAAVEGNGQRELLRAVAGLIPFSGIVRVSGDGGPGFVPEDRQAEGLILDFTLAENFALGEGHGFLLSQGYLESRAAVAVDEFRIRTAGARQPVRALSGGNQQKVVLARVLGRRPALLIAENPTRGLDIRATREVHEAIRNAARREGMGVLFFSTDLDEVLELSDRIGVMKDGRWTWATGADRTRERLGALMLGAES